VGKSGFRGNYSVGSRKKMTEAKKTPIFAAWDLKLGVDGRITKKKPAVIVAGLGGHAVFCR
jgi:hypothetical protein